MMRSMFAAVSGLRAHQLMMDVVGDNIANVNTAGYKASRVLFEDTLSQAIRGGSAADATQGGINPEQVGLGVRVGAVDMVDTQGAMQNTGRPTDVAIKGAGYFVTRSGTENMYTRAGSFGFDASGNLVDPSGFVVQGWLPDPVTGKISTTGPASDLTLPLGQVAAPKATTNVKVGGNISADAASGDVVSTSITVIDTLGAAHKVTVDLTKDAAANTWHLAVTDESGTQTGPDLTFDPTTGALTSPTSAPTFNLTPTTGATPSTYSIDFGIAGQPDAITQFGGSSTAIAIDQDGTESSYLRSFSIADDGSISGVYSDGRTKTLGQIALATFNNPGGLMKAGAGHFRTGPASGEPVISAAGTASAGTLAAGSLEMSNVDLAQEFTNLIIAQRGFQANAKVITASDELLQDLVNLKR